MKIFPGLSFSWKRALGITRIKTRVSRRLGVPLSRSGAQRKLGGFIFRLFTRKR